MPPEQVTAALTSGDLAQSGTFICGHPKSGTSLLMTLLDSHPQLIVYPEETGFFRRFASRSEGMPLDDQVRLAEDLILHIFQWNQENPPESQRGFPDRDYSGIHYEAVKQCYHAFVERLGASFASILPAAVLAYGSATGQLGDETLRWVEKTPYNEYFADQIFAFWPQARCIHILRDPRDNYASYRRKHPDWTPEAFARSWLESTSCGWRNAQMYGQDRYLLLRYEDLVTAPEDALARIIEFLGIRDDPILRRPTRAGQPWGGNSMFGDRFAGVSTQPLGRYKEALDQSDLRRLEGALFPEMERLGYEPESRGRVGLWGKRIDFLARIKLSNLLARARGQSPGRSVRRWTP